MKKVTIPFLGADDEVGKIISFKFAENEFVDKDKDIIEIETSKTTIVINSENECGYINFIKKIGDNVSQEEVVAYLNDKKNNFIDDDIEKTKIDKTNPIITKNALNLINEKKIDKNEVLKFYKNKKLLSEKDVEEFISLHDKHNKEDISIKNDGDITIQQKNLLSSKKNIIPAYLQASIYIEKDKYFLEKILRSIFLAVDKFDKFKMILINNNYQKTTETVLGLIVEVDDNLLISNFEREEIMEDFDKLFNCRLIKQMDILKNKKSLAKHPHCFLLSYMESDLLDYQIPVVFHNNNGILGVIYNKKFKKLYCTLTYNHLNVNGIYAKKFFETLLSNLLDLNNE